jgi:hypothetical protein
MDNIGYLNIDRIDDDFQSSKESLAELEKLVANIEKVNPEDENYLVLVSGENYEDVYYKIHLLQAYFDMHQKARGKIIVGPAITRDSSLHCLTLTKDERQIGEKMFSVFRLLEKAKAQVDNLISVTHGLDTGFLDYTMKQKHIVLTDDYADAKSPIDIDASRGKDITYLISGKNGLEGFNDCFDTYFEHQNIISFKR